MGYDCGTAAGLMAGAFTESTVIGTAGDTIARLPLPEAEKTRLLNNIPVAYAVSYLVGTGFVVWFLSNLAPKLLGVDLKAEARALEAQAAAGLEGRRQVRSAYREWDGRTFRLPDGVRRPDRPATWSASFAPRASSSAGSAATARSSSADAGHRPAGRRRRRSSRRAGTCCSAPARLSAQEVEDRELLDVPMAALDVVVTSREVAERPLAEIAEQHGRGVVLLKLVRGGEEIPFAPGTIVNRGDLLRLAGAEQDVERAGRALGYIERPVERRPTSCSWASASCWAACSARSRSSSATFRSASPRAAAR